VKIKSIIFIVLIITIALVVIKFGIVPAINFSKTNAQFRRAEELTKEAIQLSQDGCFREAVEKYKEAIELFRGNWRVRLVHNNLAWLLATCPDDSMRNGIEAIKHAQKYTPTTWSELDTLGAAYAEAAQFDNAVLTIEKAIAIAPDEAKNRLENRMKLYLNQLPYRQTHTADNKPLQPTLSRNAGQGG
jgi:Flp pilus assembly protein TadD